MADESILMDGSNTSILTRNVVKNLHGTMLTFNSEVDRVFSDFDEYGDNNQHNATGSTQQNVNKKCQITYIVDAKERICYAIDEDGWLY